MLNSLLVLLNSRDSMRERIGGPISVHLSQLKVESNTRSEEARKRGEGQVHISISSKS